MGKWKNRKGRFVLWSLCFFVVGTAFVCWQEQEEETVVTYGEFIEYVKEHDGELPKWDEDTRIRYEKSTEEEQAEAEDIDPSLQQNQEEAFQERAGNTKEEGEQAETESIDSSLQQNQKEASQEGIGNTQEESEMGHESQEKASTENHPSKSSLDEVQKDTIENERQNHEKASDQAVPAFAHGSLYGGSINAKKIANLYQTHSLEYLLQNFYIINPTTTIDKKIFQVDKLLDWDCTMEKKQKPQILIFHTHGASEHFAGGKTSEDDSVIGVGTCLKNILEKEYGYCVLHDTRPYDLIDGEIDRNLAYTEVENALAKTLQKYPTLEVMIDLHRDASCDGKTKRVTMVGDERVAQVMFFNGLSRNLSGNIDYLYNPNLQGNLAFSLQMKIKAMEYFEDFTLPIFLKGYRYSLHLREKSLLIELGNEVNTVTEAKNAMEPLAYILDAVLSGRE